MADAPVLRVHAIMLGARDLDASVRFYTGTLGLELKGRFGDFAMIDAGGTTLMLSTQLARARPATEPGAVEVVLEIDGVRAAYDAFRERGVTFLNEPHTIDGTNDVANFEDPDRHLFSLYGKP